MDIKSAIRQWMLPIAMLTGASVYLIYHVLPPEFHEAGPLLEDIIGVVQPLLIFSMLFLTFCRIEPRDLKVRKWHWLLLATQGVLFTLLGFAAFGVLRMFPKAGHDALVLIESAMLCLICPTATAAAVLTRKLGGDVAGITTYTVLINMLVAFLVPLVVPMLYPVEGMSFGVAFGLILAKIFPLLILPCLAAWMVRYLFPRLHRWLLGFPDLAFYIWSVSLTLAIAVSVKYLVSSTLGLGMIGLIAFVSLICAVFQFAFGRYVGSRLHSGCEGREACKVTAGQSLGQKNTVFAIWMAYTFMSPETAIVGGFYSIWHNIFNSWQLRKKSISV